MSKKYCDISQFRVVSSKDTYYIFLYFDYYFCHLILMMNIHKTSKILSWIETLKYLTRKVDLLVAFFQEFNYSGKYRNQCASKYNQQYYCLLDIKLVFWSILVTLIRNHHTLECNPEKVCRSLHSKSSVNREGPHESLRYTVGGKLKNIWRFHEFFRRVHMLCYFMHYF